MEHPDIIRLCDLDFGATGEITKVCIDEEKSKRITQLGIIKGSTIQKMLCSPFKDPCAYFVHGSLIALRNHDAHNIFVRKLTNGE
ncbi:MAG: ferrous iron transport protein A [Oscillospiraceae bacterium]|nr:ferrous iron transport protein A [Oscillospiraceae bacterium]